MITGRYSRSQPNLDPIRAPGLARRVPREVHAQCLKVRTTRLLRSTSTCSIATLRCSILFQNVCVSISSVGHHVAFIIIFGATSMIPVRVHLYLTSCLYLCCPLGCMCPLLIRSDTTINIYIYIDIFGCILYISSVGHHVGLHN